VHRTRLKHGLARPDEKIDVRSVRWASTATRSGCLVEGDVVPHGFELADGVSGFLRVDPSLHILLKHLVLKSRWSGSFADPWGFRTGRPGWRCIASGAV
jgi:hypothetical protein